VRAKYYYVYIMTNKWNKVLYTGVTNDLQRRGYQHKQGITGGFTSRYNGHKLVYYEVLEDAYEAIQREKQIKSGSRRKKVDLIDGMNPRWEDLYGRL
jgi:putative endonuclease